MADRRETYRISRMSFRELKRELHNCQNSPQKELFIRRLMKKRYLEAKAKLQAQQISQTASYGYLGDDDDDEIVFTADDFEPEEPQPMESFDEWDKQNFSSASSDDERYKKIQKDDLNNNLLDRMNSDIDINRNRRRKHDFVPPFADDSGGTYAPFSEQSPGIIPGNDFRVGDDTSRKSRRPRSRR